MFIDVRKPHLIPVCKEKVFVELPDGRVVKLKKWLYGMRKAANSWEEFYTEKLVEKGFPGRVFLPSGFLQQGGLPRQLWFMEMTSRSRVLIWNW